MLGLTTVGLLLFLSAALSAKPEQSSTVGLLFVLQISIILNSNLYQDRQEGFQI